MHIVINSFLWLDGFFFTKALEAFGLWKDVIVNGFSVFLRTQYYF